MIPSGQFILFVLIAVPQLKKKRMNHLIKQMTNLFIESGIICSSILRISHGLSMHVQRRRYSYCLINES